MAKEANLGEADYHRCHKQEHAGLVSSGWCCLLPIASRQALRCANHFASWALAPVFKPVFMASYAYSLLNLWILITLHPFLLVWFSAITKNIME